MISKRNSAFICVTDFCNAKCSFCDFWKTPRANFISKEDIQLTIDAIRTHLKCGFLEITGGEPFTYPYLNELLSAASQSGMITQLMTHGGFLSKSRIEDLKKSGLNIISISIDHYDHEIFNNHRGIKNLSEIIRENLPLFQDTGIITSAGITISKHNSNELEEIADYALNLGFDLVFYSFPVMNTESTYKIGWNSPESIDFTNDELANLVLQIKKVKKKLGSKLVHNDLFLDDLYRFYTGQKQRFACKSGENVFFIDNKLDVYECMVKDNVLGNLKGEIKLIDNAECFQCPLQCQRESSLMYHGIRSLPFQWDLVKRKETWRILKRKFL